MGPPTLQPQDKRSRVPNLLAFIIYYILPILSFSAFAYYMHQKHNLFVTDGDNYWFLVGCLVSVVPSSFGIRHENKKGDFDDSLLSEDVSPSEKLSSVRLFLESFDETRSSNFPFGFDRKSWTTERRKNEIQLQKERFAIRLSGSRQGIPSALSFREYLYFFCIFHSVVPWIVRIFRPEIHSLDDFSNLFTYSKFHHLLLFICIIILLSLFSFQYGLYTAWNLQILGIAGKEIRALCRNKDPKKFPGIKREELEWWIEGILMEHSDSFELAEERRRIIIAPIQNMICETTFAERYFKGWGNNVNDVKDSKVKMCSDCNSTRCCLSKDVKAL